jgi:hypothetical protein
VLICGGCAEGIPEREAEYLHIHGHKVLLPCKKCREKFKKRIAEYPKKAYKSKKEPPK